MTYWDKRLAMRYYEVARSTCEAACPNPTSVIDVGSNGCPHLEWFPQAPKRVSIDLHRPYEAPDIQSLKQDFMTYEADERFDLCICLQVIEHVSDPKSFAERLLSTARHLVVSAPHMWPAGACEHHCNDPVSEEKMRSWFGMDPVSSTIVQEPPKRWAFRQHIGIGRTSARSKRIVNLYMR